MDIQKVGAPLRFFLLVVGIVLWVGIWHTGFEVASWVLYIPAIFLPLAAATGICPGMIFSRRLFNEKTRKA